MTATPEATAFDPAVPLQHQIYLQVRSEIEDGLWLDRDDFPGERDLADRFGVSVITTRAALDRLAKEGWVERSRGRGTCAIHRPATRETPAGPALLPVPVPVGRVQYRYDVLESSVRIAPVDDARLRRAGRQRPMAVQPASHLSRSPAQRQPERGTVRGRAPPSRRGPGPPSDVRTARGSGHRPPLHAPAIPRRDGATVRRPPARPYDRRSGAHRHVHDARREGVCIEWVRIYVHPDSSAAEETMNLDTGTWTVTQR